jgi:uncharacterized membrane protein YkoI
MQNQIRRSMMTWTLIAGVAALGAACASTKEAREKKKEAAETVTMAQLSPGARATVERATAGGTIDKMTKEDENGKTIYDVEATVGGKHMEWTIAPDGTVTGTETGIAYSELPDSIRASAEKFFGTATGLEAVKGVEDGKSMYEVTGQKNGKKVTAEYDASGKFVGQE